MISADDLLEVVGVLERAELWYRLDGGWGIDALLGEETRERDDVDLVVDRAELDRYRTTLAAIGFEHDAEAQPGPPARFVLRHREGRRIDLHPVGFDER